VTLRVDSAKILVQNNKYYLNGELFSGIAIKLSGCVVREKMRIDAGVHLGSYTDDLIKINQEQLMVDFSCLKEEEHGPDVPYNYQGSRFSGVAFEFIDAICVGEYAYEDGWKTDSVSFRRSGDLAGFDLMENDFSQRAIFFECGNLESIYLFKKELFHATFAFDDANNITVINIEGAYFDNIKNYSNSIKCSIPESKNFTELKGADCVKISGSGIDDELFTSLCQTGLNNTSELWFWRTKMTLNSISMLINLDKLKELNVESDVLTVDDLKKFKSQRPDCYVEFNREEVTV